MVASFINVIVPVRNQKDAYDILVTKLDIQSTSTLALQDIKIWMDNRVNDNFIFITYSDFKSIFNNLDTEGISYISTTNDNRIVIKIYYMSFIFLLVLLSEEDYKSYTETSRIVYTDYELSFLTSPPIILQYSPRNTIPDLLSFINGVTVDE